MLAASASVSAHCGVRTRLLQHCLLFWLIPEQGPLECRAHTNSFSLNGEVEHTTQECAQCLLPTEVPPFAVRVRVNRTSRAKHFAPVPSTHFAILVHLVWQRPWSVVGIPSRIVRKVLFLLLSASLRGRNMFIAGK